MAKKGLGRGLDEIFRDNSFDDPADRAEEGRQTVLISLIDTNPNQPRKSFGDESLDELAGSISENGLLQPIIVRPKDGRYEIVAGERRFRAARIAGLSEIPAVIIKADDREAAVYALIENLQREDLNPYEEALAFKSLKDEYGLTQEEVSKQIGKPRSTVANSLRLLDLPESITSMLTDGTLSSGHCRALLGLKDMTLAPDLAARISERGMSVRETEEAVRKLNGARKPKDDGERQDGINVDYIGDLEKRFTSVTGRLCRITDSRKKKFIEIEYRDEEDLEAIIRTLAGDDVLKDF